MSLFNKISSMKFGIVLLGLIGVMSALGSLVSPDNFYKTMQFKLLLVLLIINLMFCTNRQIMQLFKRAGRTAKPKNKVARFGNVLIHAGILLVMVGGALNAHYGKALEVSIAEGGTVDISTLMPTREPLQVQLQQISIEYNADGSPAQYSSVINAGDGVRDQGHYIISVNHPLTLAGIKAYQQSLGYQIKMQSNFGPDQLLHIGQILSIPNTERQIRINGYAPNFDPYRAVDPSLRPDNPQVIISVYERGVALGTGIASFNQTIKIADDTYITFTGVQPFTVLRLKSDPGIPYAAAGALLLVGGICFGLLYKPLGVDANSSDVQGGLGSEAVLNQNQRCDSVNGRLKY
jgi:cytochrome c biogenesis protein